MKHISKLSQATALVAALGAACLTSLSAHAADTPNAGTLTLKAMISATTCAVVIGENGANPGTSSYKAVNLGNIASDNKSNAKGVKFGTQKAIMFSLKDPTNPNQACTLTNISSGWQVKTNLAATQLTNLGDTAAPKYYLKNSVVGGTDAAVALGTGLNELTLKEGENVLTSGGKLQAAASMWAQFVYSTTGQATPGKYNFLMPVTITYN